MSQPQSDNCPQNQDDGKPVDQFFRQALTRGDFLEQQIGQQKTAGQKQTVPADAKVSEMEKNRVGVPSNVCKHGVIVSSIRCNAAHVELLRVLPDLCFFCAMDSLRAVVFTQGGCHHCFGAIFGV